MGRNKMPLSVSPAVLFPLAFEVFLGDSANEK